VWTVGDGGKEEDDEENKLGLLLMRMVLWWMNKKRGKNGGEILGLNNFLGAKRKEIKNIAQIDARRRSTMEQRQREDRRA
jgi:hypothetical protein